MNASCRFYRAACLSLFVGCLSLITTGCHTIRPAVVNDPKDLTGKKNMFVVRSETKDRGFLKEIERNLTARGFVVSSGTLAEMGPDAELYTTYMDKWAWDMVMYPQYVKIAIYDAKTKAEVGACEFQNSAFHTYPDPPEITDELLGRIFGEPPGSHMK